MIYLESLSRMIFRRIIFITFSLLTFGSYSLWATTLILKVTKNPDGTKNFTVLSGSTASYPMQIPAAHTDLYWTVSDWQVIGEFVITNVSNSDQTPGTGCANDPVQQNFGPVTGDVSNGHVVVTAAGLYFLCNDAAVATYTFIWTVGADLTITPTGPPDLDYKSVMVGYTSRRGIQIGNNGDVDVNVTIRLSQSSSNNGQWGFAKQDNTPITIDNSHSYTTVIPHGMDQIFYCDYKPQSAGASDNLTLEFDPDDNEQTIEAILTGYGIDPVPLNNVLILDRSGSMSETAGGATTKIEALCNAASLYSDLLLPTDKIAFIKYNQNNSFYPDPNNSSFQNPTTLGDIFGNGATTNISKLKPSGRTGIGGAMKTGAQKYQYQLGGIQPRYIMVVMTDGKENENPTVSEAFQNSFLQLSHWRIYSVGLGTNTEIDLGTLNQIAKNIPENVMVNNDLSYTDQNKLEEFYFKIFANASDMALPIDPAVIVDLNIPSTQIVSKAHIVSSDHAATFVVLDDPEMRQFYDLEFKDPTGQVMQAGATVGGIAIEYTEKRNYRIYKVTFPGENKAYSYVGDWTLQVKANGSWDPKKVLEISHRYYGDSTRNVSRIHPENKQVLIGFLAAVKSDYKMNVEISPSRNEPGADIFLTANLKDMDWPSSGKVYVDVTRPDNTVISNIELVNQKNRFDSLIKTRLYSAHFFQTGLPGVYKFTFHGVGRNFADELVPRFETHYVGLVVPNNTTNVKSIPTIIYWLFLILIVLLFILVVSIILCCRRKNLAS